MAKARRQVGYRPVCILFAGEDGNCAECGGESAEPYLRLIVCPDCQKGFCGYDWNRHAHNPERLSSMEARA